VERPKNNQRFLWLLPILLIAMSAGCWLFSGTWVIIFIADDEDIEAGEGFYKFKVDITQESVWQDHHDDLDNIEDISITFKLTNNLSGAATARVYVSDDSALSDTTAVKSSATLILSGISVPGNDSLHVNLAGYYNLLQHFDELRDLAKTGVFTAYGIIPDMGVEPDLDVLFEDVVVIVTFSAGM
jgi:hypothetical protein